MMNKPIEQLFDVKNLSLTFRKCKRLFDAILQEQQEFHLDNDIESHHFLPGILTQSFNSSSSSCQYQWNPRNAAKILALVIRFLHVYYPRTEEVRERNRGKRDVWPSFHQSLQKRSEKEADLQDSLVRGDLIKRLPGFDLLYDFEWEPVKGHSQYGCNDLIFTNGFGIVAVVETKIVQNHREKCDRGRRKKVLEQATKYKNEFARKHCQELDFDVFAVIGITFTDARGGTIGYVNRIDQKIAAVVKKVSESLPVSRDADLEPATISPNMLQIKCFTEESTLIFPPELINVLPLQLSIPENDQQLKTTIADILPPTIRPNEINN
jgi:hypothetical protein